MCNLEKFELQRPWRAIIFLLIPLDTQNDDTNPGQGMQIKEFELTSPLERLKWSINAGI